MAFISGVAVGTGIASSKKLFKSDVLVFRQLYEGASDKIRDHKCQPWYSTH